MLDQQLEYRRLQKGKESNMIPEKLERFKSIGVEFSHTTWQEHFDQYKKWKEDNGNVQPPSRHVLGRWVKLMRRQAQTLLEGKVPKDLTHERLQQLTELGFADAPETILSVTKKESFDEEFDKLFAKLREFKQNHGDCLVKKSHTEHTDLFNWVVRIRIEYRKLQEGKPCRMNIQQLQRLTDIGFAFVQRERCKSWAHRVKQLKVYKEEHGLCNVPVSHPELGEFVQRQRKQHRNKPMGIKGPLNDEREQIIRDVGFDFRENHWKDTSTMAAPKSWEERYQELLEFREEHGHTVVSQHYPGLGYWVHKQRQEIKLIRRGEKTCMTSEKAKHFVWQILALSSTSLNCEETRKRWRAATFLIEKIQIVRCIKKTSANEFRDHAITSLENY
jgi:hypothetical protein